MEGDESFKEAAVRELLENTGLMTKPEYLEVLPQEWQAKMTKSYGTKIFAFKSLVCRKYEGSVRETSSSVPVWFQISRLGEVELAPNTREAILAAGLLRPRR